MKLLVPGYPLVSLRALLLGTLCLVASACDGSVKQRISTKLDGLSKAPPPSQELGEQLPADVSFPSGLELSSTTLTDFVHARPPRPFQSDTELCRREVSLREPDASVLRFCDGAKYAVRISLEQRPLDATPEFLISNQVYRWFETTLAFTLVSLDGPRSRALAKREDRLFRARRTDLSGPTLRFWNAGLVNDALGRWKAGRPPRTCAALEKAPADPLPCACVECEPGQRCIVLHGGAPLCVVN